MSALLPAFRLTLFAPRSVDVTEATVLTPSSNAATTDAFQVITLPATSFRPYMGLPTGRRGRLDPLTKAVDIGEFTVPILDSRITAGSTDNATRWVAQFAGNSAGQPQLMGLKAKIEESVDGGLTWAAYFTGRVSDVKLQNRLQWNLTLRDMSEDMKMPVFSGLPSTAVLAPGFGVAPATSAYAQSLSLLPLGLVQPYASTMYMSTGMMTAQVTSSWLFSANGVTYRAATLQLNAPSLSRVDNLVTHELDQQTEVVTNGVPLQYVNLMTGTNDFGGRVHIEYGAATSAVGEVMCSGVMTVRDTNYPGPVYRAQQILIQELPRLGTTSAAPPGYVAVPTTSEANINLYVYGSAQGGVRGSQFPIFLSDVHPIQLLQDLLGGYYGYLWRPTETIPATLAAGQPKKAIAVNAAAFATLIADPTYPPARCVLSATDQLDRWVQANILQAFQVGYYFDGLGQFTPVDLRPLASLPSNTITDADLVEGDQPAWEYSRDAAVLSVTATYYRDFPTGTLRDRLLNNDLPTVAGLLVEPLPKDGTFIYRLGGPYISATALSAAQQNRVTIPNIGAADVFGSDQSYDCQTLRGTSNEVLFGAGRMEAIPRWIAQQAQNLTLPFGRGSQTFSLSCRRTANTDLWPGQYSVVTVTNLVDPGTNLRGGSRVGMVVERSEAGLKRTLKFLDLGLNITAAAPTLSNVTQQTGNTQHGAAVGVTFNPLRMPVEIHYAVSSSGVVAAPATSDASWKYGLRVPYSTAATASIANLQGGSTGSITRVWVRGRSVAGSSDPMHQPSSWVQASSNGYVDLVPITAPSALATSSISGSDAAILFTPGDLTLQTQVSLVTPSTGVLSQYSLLPPGSVRAPLHGLVLASSYKVGLTHLDGMGGGSATVTLNFSAASTALTLPAMAYFGVLSGGA